MNKLEKIIKNKDWDSLILTFTVEEICCSLTFTETMHLVDHLFLDDFLDDDKQQYALKLIFQLKKHFNNEWENDWKNEVYLGKMCALLWLYDERYQSYKRAYDKLKDPPAELLYLLSCCNSAPGKPPISNAESEHYLRRALEKKLTFEIAVGMRELYLFDEDGSERKYWDEMAKKLEEEGVKMELLIPDVLKE